MSVEDKLYKFNSYYKTLPDWIKVLITLPFKFFPRELFLGNKYKKFIKISKEYEFSSKDKIREYQFNQIKKTLFYAKKYIPFYQKKWNQFGVNLKSIQNFEDYKRDIPFTTREDIIKSYKDMVSLKYPDNEHLICNSGGTSGIPITIYYLRGFTRIADRAHGNLLWSRIGYKVGDKYARIRGDWIGKNKIYTYDPYRNCVILNTYILCKDNAKLYLETLFKKKVKYIAAYPAALYNLIQLSQLEKYEIPSLSGIMLGSENIFKFQLDKFKAFFGVNKILTAYGHGELAGIAGNCNFGYKYHFSPTFSYNEFLDPKIPYPNYNGKIVKEIVGTTFYNPLMPLIRYRTKDFGIESKNNCACGREHDSLDVILGREQEIVEGLNGELITLTGLIHGRHANYLHHINKIQLIHNKPGFLHIKIVPKDSFNKEHQNEIITTLSEKGGVSFQSEVEIVDDIESTKSGKHKILIKTF